MSDVTAPGPASDPVPPPFRNGPTQRPSSGHHPAPAAGSKQKPRDPLSRGRGQPTKLNPEVREMVMAAIRGGAGKVDAVTRAGISFPTHRNWMKRGQRATLEAERTGRKVPAGDALFVEYFYAIKKADVDKKFRLLALIQRAGRGGELVEEKTVTSPDGTVTVTRKFTRPEWTANAWILERQFAEEYGPQRLELAKLRRDYERQLKNYLALEQALGRHPDAEVPPDPMTTPVGNPTTNPGVLPLSRTALREDLSVPRQYRTGARP